MTGHITYPKHRSCVAGSLLAVGLSACGPAEGVQVQGLPPSERPTLEARAGLQEIQGAWNHAGWVVTTSATDALLPPHVPASVAVQEQRLDSLSGHVAHGEVSRRFVGELRRDGIFALLLPAPEAAGAVLAGVVERDTLWLELSTLPDLEIPAGARAAYVRAPVGRAWVRLPSGALLRDTVVAPVTPPAADASGATPPREATPQVPRETPQVPRETPPLPREAPPPTPRDTPRPERPRPDTRAPTGPPVREQEPDTPVPETVTPERSPDAAPIPSAEIDQHPAFEAILDADR